MFAAAHDSVIFASRVAMIIGFTLSALAAFRLWWHVRRYKNSGAFLAAGVASFASVGCFAWFTYVNATDVAIVATNIAASSALTSWALVGDYLDRFRRDG